MKERILNVNIDDLNKNIKNDYNDYILTCENYYKNQIKELVEEIKLSSNVKFVLLAGPSSSGKTTTAKLLKEELDRNGFNAQTISLDDFFVEREDTPVWDDGKPNYETIDAIDWKLFAKCIHALETTGTALMPTYDFVVGKKFFQQTLTLNKNDIIVIEGLHSLNPVLDNYIAAGLSVKVYLEPLVKYYSNNQEIMDGKKLRLFRRLIRDLYTRGISAEKTLASWELVRKGEKLYISPFKDTANFTINTCHPYEICIYKYIIDFLGLNKKPEYDELLEPFKYFEMLIKETMPEGSLLQEFVH